MKDRPVIFSAPMIGALLDGRKSMTRRLAWQDPKPYPGVECKHGYDACPECDAPRPSLWQRVQPGDRLWARETFSGPWQYENLPPSKWQPFDNWYWADGNPQNGSWTRPRSPIHMPRWASRVTLIVTAAKIKRLQDISEEDAIAEGVRRRQGSVAEQFSMDGEYWWGSGPRGAFLEFWRHLHGAGAWDANPEVCAISFTVHKTNIDQMKEAA